MPDYSTSVPSPIIRATSQPAAADYYFWINTDTGDTYQSDGSTWTKLNVDTSQFNDVVLENSLDILELQANATLAGGQSAQMVRDLFSDSDGYVNTVDTGNTTAPYDAGNTKYVNNATDDISATGVDASRTTKCGIKITPNRDLTISSIELASGCDATTGYILDASKSVIVSAAFVGATCTFTTLNALTNGTTYYLAVDSGGSAFTNKAIGGQSFPTVLTNITITGGLLAGADNSTNKISLENVKSIADVIIQTDAIALGTTPANFQVFAFDDTIAGTGTIDLDISFDNGANYQTAVALDTPTTITDAGSTMILKLNLNVGASSGTAEALGYGVLFW